MKRIIFRSITFILALSAAALAGAQGAPTSYASMAPVEQYLMNDRAEEIALARSAAPASIADKADVLVLARDGYITAVKGDNGFVCLVARSWAKSTDDPEFWSPKVSAPMCVNAPAAKTYLPLVLMKAKLALAGKSRTEIAQALTSALDKKVLPPLEPNAMAYMLSKQQYLGDSDVHWHPHMMWYAPGDATQSWGANLPGSPAYAGFTPQDRMTTFFVVIRKWSDGTEAMQMAH